MQRMTCSRNRGNREKKPECYHFSTYTDKHQNTDNISAVSSGTCIFSHSIKLLDIQERVNESGTTIQLCFSKMFCHNYVFPKFKYSKLNEFLYLHKNGFVNENQMNTEKLTQDAKIALPRLWVNHSFTTDIPALLMCQHYTSLHHLGGLSSSGRMYIFS